MNARNPVEFYFDFSSPYSYIASEWVEAVAARHGRTVRWHAILLGATFQAAELKSPVSYPVKREYALADFQRSARFEGVPYRAPERFPIPTQNAARVFWWLADREPERAAGLGPCRAARLLHARRGARCAGAAEGAVCRGRARREAAEAAWGDPAWKARLKAENDAAIAAGVFGAPSFLVDGELFWGNDRRAQLERWLATGPF
ncbi:2-hydroxychromene-2-carboxylate isomerase [Methylibium sp. T29]|uniref:2-hydroxychromene-2-carboxylate isomerase n=1 Tax=Methylibium sp. T29 TaxID=1430884 RepID=UPI0003F40BDF|nr:2-hydroxychromene-2-carboxylate isomerase [Methylibium sp. T29]EWS52532.1 2-hydroxychromene-2-carboxylate isomerase [Methylibium sp. T29]